MAGTSKTKKVARWARWAWVGVLIGAGAFELYGVANPETEDTLSETTRWIFHTDSTAGRWTFTVLWGAFAAWFSWHITGTKED